MIWFASARPLPWFVVLSFGLHLFVFASLGQFTGGITTRYLGQPVLSVQMQDITPEKVPLPPKTVSSDSPSTRNHTAYIASIPTTPQVAVAPVTSSRIQVAASEPNTNSTIATEAGTRNQLLGELQTHLSPVYPPLARRRGWEGTVLLGLRVESDGHINGIHIERSSGYAVLDHSALNSLIRLGYIAEASSWLNGHDMEMQLSVIYRLIEN